MCDNAGHWDSGLGWARGLAHGGFALRVWELELELAAGLQGKRRCGVEQAARLAVICVCVARAFKERAHLNLWYAWSFLKLPSAE